MQSPEEPLTKEEEGLIGIVSLSSKSNRSYGGGKEDVDREFSLIRGRNRGFPGKQAGP